MPELAEVAYFAKQWRAAAGATVLRVTTHPAARVFRETPARKIVAALRGAKFEEAITAGKQAAFRFSGGHWLGIHLGMAGRLFVEEHRHDFSPWAENPAAAPKPAHDHLALHMSSGVVLVYNDPRMFGAVRLHTGTEAPDWWKAIPPALTSPAFTLPVLRGILRAHPGPLLKALLLDQRHFPGIGNWMADEILWRSHISPHRRVRTLNDTETAGLHKTIREVCRDALEVIGETWYPTPDHWLFNHRWQRGGKCPRDGTPLTYEKIGGRTACWCAKCQK